MKYNLKPDDRATLELRGLYEKYGYRKYKIGKFEEYSLYAANRDFLAGDKVLILSVCKNGDTEHKHRFLIVGKMIEDTADPETWAMAETADDTTATE